MEGSGSSLFKDTIALFVLKDWRKGRKLSNKISRDRNYNPGPPDDQQFDCDALCLSMAPAITHFALASSSDETNCRIPPVHQWTVQWRESSDKLRPATSGWTSYTDVDGWINIYSPEDIPSRHLKRTSHANNSDCYSIVRNGNVNWDIRIASCKGAKCIQYKRNTFSYVHQDLFMSHNNIAVTSSPHILVFLI
jgi:hypothetical protein